MVVESVVVESVLVESVVVECVLVVSVRVESVLVIWAGYLYWLKMPWLNLQCFTELDLA